MWSPGVWSLRPGVWFPGPGVWSQGPGVWSQGPGVWCQVPGVWGLHKASPPSIFEQAQDSCLHQNNQKKASLHVTVESGTRCMHLPALSSVLFLPPADLLEFLCPFGWGVASLRSPNALGLAPDLTMGTEGTEGNLVRHKHADNACHVHRTLLGKSDVAMAPLPIWGPGSGDPDADTGCGGPLRC